MLAKSTLKMWSFTTINERPDLAQLDRIASNKRVPVCPSNREKAVTNITVTKRTSQD
jgi:hypothetical protein